MSQSQHEKERLWRVKKEDQHPHGKVKSFEQLAEDKGNISKKK